MEITQEFRLFTARHTAARHILRKFGANFNNARFCAHIGEDFPFYEQNSNLGFINKYIGVNNLVSNIKVNTKYGKIFSTKKLTYDK